MKTFEGIMKRSSTLGYYTKGQKVTVTKNDADTCYRLKDKNGNSIIPQSFIQITKQIK